MTLPIRINIGTGTRLNLAKESAILAIICSNPADPMRKNTATNRKSTKANAIGILVSMNTISPPNNRIITIHQSMIAPYTPFNTRINS